MTRTLTRLKIREISSVDKGAGEGTRIVLMKRHDETPLGKRLRQIFKAKAPMVRPTEVFDEDDIDAGADERRREDEPLDHDDTSTVHPQLQRFVAGLVAANPQFTPEQALHYLLHSAHGRVLAQHMSDITKEHRPMTTFKEMAKHIDVVKIAKIITDDNDPHGVTEHEFTALVMEAAKLQKKQGESDAQAFSRLFEQDLTIRKAHAITKSFPNVMRTTPLSVETSSTEVVDDSYEAAKQLAALVDEQRRLAPTLTTSQLYDRVYADTNNKPLLARAHRRSSTSGDELQR
jgi:hypothetical protein